MDTQQGQVPCRQALAFTVSDSFFVKAVILIGPLQDLQEVNPAFCGATFEIGEKIRIDTGTELFPALVRSAGIIDANLLAGCYASHKNLLHLLGKQLYDGIFVQNVVYLPCRYVYPQGFQVLVDQWLAR